jgi:hypothetical protein
MLIFISLITLLFFIFIGSDEKQGIQSIFRKFMNFLKAIFLIAFIFQTLYFGFLYFKPLIINENKNTISEINKFAYFNNTFQNIEFKNDSEEIVNFYFLLQTTYNNWEITKPVNKFDITYKCNFPVSSDYNLFFQSDTGKYKALCFYKSQDSIEVKSNVYNIPVNKIAYFTTEEGMSDLPDNIDFYNNIENIIFIIISIYVYILVTLRNFPLSGIKRILFFLLLLILIAISGMLGYREIMFFWDFYFENLLRELINF